MQAVSSSKCPLVQPYSLCAFVDKYETPPLVCIVLISIGTDIFLKFFLRCMVAESVHMVVPESHSPSNCHSTMAISSERVPLLGLRPDGTIARPADCLSGLPLHCVQPPWDELQARYLVREFCEVRDRAGIPDFRFHDMRHTFATRLIQCGVDLHKTQRLLGRKTSLTTQRYAHHSPESLREGVNVWDEPQPQQVSTNLAQEPILNGLARASTLASTGL